MKLVACKSAPGFLDANIDRMLDLKEERRATLFSWAGRRLPSRQMFEAWDAVAEAACAVIIMKRLACHEKMNDLLQTSRDQPVMGQPVPGLVPPETPSTDGESTRNTSPLPETSQETATRGTDTEGTDTQGTDAQKTKTLRTDAQGTTTQVTPEFGSGEDTDFPSLLSLTPSTISEIITSVGQISEEASGAITGVHHTAVPVQNMEVRAAEGLDGRRAARPQQPAAAQKGPRLLGDPFPRTVQVQSETQGLEEGMMAGFQHLQAEVEESNHLPEQGEVPVIRVTQAETDRVASIGEAMEATVLNMG
ncbi:uncharacterized protein [Scyliorhinus torazame]|uniref:uncharacterized protein isoform X2 n=1 Tax=Scyliorhinus torazame TaxID=75743 RepID=UPI003B5B0520